MRIDFFVHPEHAYFVRRQYCNPKYIRDIENALEHSERPVLINGNFQGDLASKFDTILDSTSYTTSNNPVNSGYVHPRSWEKFKEIVNEGSTFRVHGSFAEQCVLGFCIQLVRLIEYEEHWWSDPKGRNNEGLEDNLHTMSKEGIFAKSLVRLGVVHQHKKRISPPKFLTSMIGYSYGTMFSQLCDNETKKY